MSGNRGRMQGSRAIGRSSVDSLAMLLLVLRPANLVSNVRTLLGVPPIEKARKQAYHHVLRMDVPDDLLQVSEEDRATQWQLMKHNFGTRWEGETQWFKPSNNSFDDLLPATDPLTSIYQLEFPRSAPDEGTWRGWGLFKPGDTRATPLSKSTVIERQRSQGGTTFQFAGVGGRHSLRADVQSWAVEVNFFHAGRRCGLVLYYSQLNNSHESSMNASLFPLNVMCMSFRGTPYSSDGNLTFVSSPVPLRDPQHTLANCTAARDYSFAEPEHGRTRLEIMNRSFVQVSFAASDVEENGSGLSSFLSRNYSDRVRWKLPDDIWLSVPRELSSSVLHQKLVFGCDFRRIGGPLRMLSIDIESAECTQWTCEEYAGPVS